MKTKKKVLQDNPSYKKLINAVLDALNDWEQNVRDINSHGINGGYGKFIYYSDTHAFAMKHRKDIIKMLEDDAEQFGEEVVGMVSHFGVFRNSKMDNEDRKELYRYLGMGKCEQSTITNLMAWYAGETVCRMFED